MSFDALVREGEKNDTFLDREESVHDNDIMTSRIKVLVYTDI
jgi:hypothetical protein